MSESKTIRLRWVASCQSCGLKMEKGSRAIWRSPGQIHHVHDCQEPPVTLARDTAFLEFCQEVGIKTE